MTNIRRTLSQVAGLEDGVKISVPTDIPDDGPVTTDHSEYYISRKYESEAGPVDIHVARVKFQSVGPNGERGEGTPPEAVVIAVIKYLEFLDFNRPDKTNAQAIQSLNAALDSMAAKGI